MNVALPPMVPAQEGAWIAILEVSERLDTGWCLVGGQMVHLHCAERGRFPERPTDDPDAVLDVRARPAVLLDFTRVLVDIGFESDGESWEGHQQRWRRDTAVIDLLIPRFLGPLASKRRGIYGGTTLSTPGAQSALDAAESVEIDVSGKTGFVVRPTLPASIIAKAAAFGNSQDLHRSRHLADMATLSTLLERGDDFLAVTDLKGYRRLVRAMRAIESNTGTVADIAGAVDGMRLLSRTLARSPHSVRNGGSEPAPPAFRLR
jgi:hypothetical protein